MNSVSELLPIMLPVFACLGVSFSQGTAGATPSYSADFINVGHRSAVDGRGSVSHFSSLKVEAAAHLQPAAWLPEALQHVAQYESVTDGWKGEGSVAPTAAVIADAQRLLERFSIEIPNSPLPLISADDDGSIILYWKYDRVVASVSIHGDETFSYYVEGYSEPRSSDAEYVSMPLPIYLISNMKNSEKIDLRHDFAA